MTGSTRDSITDLQRLARAWGIDVDASPDALPDTLMAGLRSLGATVATPAEASDAYDALRLEVWDWRLEPVSVSWDGVGRVTLRMPADDAHLRIDCNVRLEDGDGHGWGVNLTDQPPFQYERIGDIDYAAKYLPLRRLPFGYHRMYVDLPGHHTESLVISAPARAYEGPAATSTIVELRPLTDVHGHPRSSLELRRSSYEPLIEHVRALAVEGATIALGNVNDWLMPRLPGVDGLRLRYEVDEILAILAHESQRLSAPLIVLVTDELPADLRAACERRGITVDENNAGATTVGYPNWRRRIRPSIEELDSAILPTGAFDVLRRERP